MHNDHDIGSFDAPCSDYDTPTPFYMISFFSCADRYFFLQWRKYPESVVMPFGMYFIIYRHCLFRPPVLFLFLAFGSVVEKGSSNWLSACIESDRYVCAFFGLFLESIRFRWVSVLGYRPLCMSLSCFFLEISDFDDNDFLNFLVCYHKPFLVNFGIGGTIYVCISYWCDNKLTRFSW